MDPRATLELLLAALRVKDFRAASAAFKDFTRERVDPGIWQTASHPFAEAIVSMMVHAKGLTYGRTLNTATEVQYIKTLLDGDYDEEPMRHDPCIRVDPYTEEVSINLLRLGNRQDLADNGRLRTEVEHARAEGERIVLMEVATYVDENLLDHSKVIFFPTMIYPPVFPKAVLYGRIAGSLPLPNVPGGIEDHVLATLVGEGVNLSDVRALVGWPVLLKLLDLVPPGTTEPVLVLVDAFLEGGMEQAEAVATQWR